MNRRDHRHLYMLARYGPSVAAFAVGVAAAIYCVLLVSVL